MLLREMLRAEVERRWAALVGLAGLFAAMPLFFAVRLQAVPEGWFALEYEQTAIFTRVLFWILVFACAAWGYDTWSPERRGGWIYALALPVKRLRLFVLRYVAGLVCLGAAALVLIAASYVAAAVVAYPAGFYAYPGPYSAWIALSGLVLYTFGFVVGAHSSRQAATLIMLLAGVAIGLAVSGQRRARLYPGDRLPIERATPIRLLAESPRLFDY
jgi:ABC-type transport system involved in multi-copper enzyme maturation permease subunit